MDEHLIITSKILSRYPNILFGMSTRLGGVSPEPLGMNLSYRVGDDRGNVEENRRRFFSSLGFDSRHAAVPVQCHSNNVRFVDRPGEYESCDGLITDTIDIPLVVTVADCLPIVLFDPTKPVVALTHAGWRGTAQGIAAETVGLLTKEVGASVGDMVAYLGPSAAVCCYEVGPDVAEVFSLDQLEYRDDRIYLDLKRANVDQLLDCGLMRENIEVSGSCTICHPDLFHSHRRDGNRSGRMMALVSLSDHSGA